METVVYDILNDAGICSGRIYPMFPPQDPTLPFVVYGLAGIERGVNVCKREIKWIVGVDLYSETYEPDLNQSIVTLLNDYADDEVLLIDLVELTSQMSENIYVYQHKYRVTFK